MGILVVLTGLPGSGKSTLARALCKENDSLTISTDDLRTSLYGKSYEELRVNGGSSDRRNEKYVRHLVDIMRDDALDHDFNVIVDSTAPNYKMRKRFLETSIVGIPRYLVHLMAPDHVIRHRVLEKYGSTKVLDFLIERWEEPIDGFCGSELIKVNSESQIYLPDLVKRLDFRSESK